MKKDCFLVFERSMKMRYPSTQTAMTSPRQTQPKLLQKRAGVGISSPFVKKVNSKARRNPLDKAGKMEATKRCLLKEIKRTAIKVAKVPTTISSGEQNALKAGE